MNKTSESYRHWIIVAAVMLFLSSSMVLHAQLSTARITGTVNDPSGAIIAGAEITLVNQVTGGNVSGRSNESGLYVVPFLSPGSYSFSVEAPGFSRYVRDLTLYSGQVLGLDIKLAVGQGSQTVTVTAATPMLQVASSDANGLIEQSFVKSFPLESGRSGALVRLLPGVTFISEEAFEPHLNFAISGGQGRSGEYRLDGGNVTLNALLTRSIEFNPPIEATQETGAEINAYPAEYGHSTGGVFSITSKSGTNHLHGVVYEDFRNNVLDARSYFARSVAPRKYNVFGVEVDGPIIQDKLFFMFSYEGTRRVDGQTRIYNYPTQQEVHGDFSDITTPIIDPLTKKQFPGNIIPASRMDPVGAKIAALYPAPNVAGAASGTNNYVANTSDHINENSYFGKIDYVLNDYNRFSLRLIEYPSTQVTGSAIPNRAEDPNAISQSFNLINGSPSWFHTFSPRLFNEIRYTYSHRNGYFPAFVPTGVAGTVGLGGVPSTGNPNINATGLTSLGQSNQYRFLRPQITQTIDEALTWVRGKHTMKFGGEYRYTFNRDRWGTSASGQLSFNNVATGNALAALELGWVNSANVVTGDTGTRTDYLGVFAQDDWKVNSVLTLNYGVRYDLDAPRWETRNVQSGFDPKAINPVSGTPGAITYAGVNGVSKYANNWDLNNIGPRLGFAWQLPGGHMVLHGGYGLIFGPEYDASLSRAMNAGFGDNRNFSSPDNGLTPAFALSGGMPLPNMGSGPGFGAVAAGKSPIYSPGFVNRDHQNLYAHHFNATMQRQLSETMMLQIGYIGNMGHRIGGGNAVNINEIAPNLRGATQNQALRPFPQYGNVMWYAPDWGNSTYSSLNVTAVKHYSRGLNFLSTYTWSKFLDNVEAPSELAPAPNAGYQSFYAHHMDKGLSGSDIRQRVTASAVYELPVGKNKTFAINNPVLDSIVGGWSLGTIAEVRSGSPYSVYEQTNKLNAFSAGQRSQLIGNPRLPTDRSRSQLVTQWFNTAAFAFPGNGVLGNSPIGVGTGPGFFNVDGSLLKNFTTFEKHTVQFRSQFYNVFNRPNFATPNTSRGSATFGKISNTVNGGRFIQLSLRYMF